MVEQRRYREVEGRLVAKRLIMAERDQLRGLEVEKKLTLNRKSKILEIHNQVEQLEWSSLRWDRVSSVG